MLITKNCNNCDNKHNCSEIYEKLGKNQGPNIAPKIFFAFFVPIVVFIASLATLENYADKIIPGYHLNTAVNFLLSLTITLLLIFVIRLLKSDLRK